MKMRNGLKRGIAFSLAAVMALGTVGCGDAKEDTKKEEASKDAGEKKNSDKPYEGVKLKWALTDNAATGSETKEMVELIKEKTGIEIEFSITPTSKAGEMDKVLVSLMAGDDIDIIGRTPLQLQEFYNAGVLEPLDEYASAIDYNMDEVYGGETVKFDDKTYAMPAEKDIWLTYYNKKVFDDAGVPYPTAEGWTWEKYVETAKQLTNKEKDVWGSFIGDDPAMEYVLASQKGIPAYKEDGSANFDDPVFTESMEWFYSLGNDLKIQPFSLDIASGTYPYNAFLVNGNIGMWVAGGWVASTLSDQEKYPRDWEAGILPMPYPEGEEPSSLQITSCYAVPTTSSNKEAAFEAIKCICENKYTLGYGRVPAKVLSEDEARTYIEEGLLPKYEKDGITVDDFMTGWFDPNRNYVSEKIMGTADTVIGQIFTEEGGLYGQGQQSLEDTMKKIQERSNKAIEEAKAK